MSLDLPIPASPESSTTWPSPVLALAQRRNSSSSSSSRPTSAVRPPACIASKRLSTELARSTANALHRPGNPLELPWPEVPQLEEIAEQPARGLGNDDRVRLGDALQAGREVRRLADNTALLRFAGPDKVSDHHHPGGNPDPHLQGLRRAERGNRIDQREAGPNCTLGVILMRLPDSRNRSARRRPCIWRRSPRSGARSRRRTSDRPR